MVFVHPSILSTNMACLSSVHLPRLSELAFRYCLYSPTLRSPRAYESYQPTASSFDASTAPDPTPCKPLPWRFVVLWLAKSDLHVCHGYTHCTTDWHPTAFDNGLLSGYSMGMGFLEVSNANSGNLAVHAS